MGFYEVWGFDPEDASRAQDSFRNLTDRDLFYGSGEDCSAEEKLSEKCSAEDEESPAEDWLTEPEGEQCPPEQCSPEEEESSIDEGSTEKEDSPAKKEKSPPGVPAGAASQVYELRRIFRL